METILLGLLSKNNLVKLSRKTSDLAANIWCELKKQLAFFNWKLFLTERENCLYKPEHP